MNENANKFTRALMEFELEDMDSMTEDQRKIVVNILRIIISQEDHRKRKEVLFGEDLVQSLLKLSNL